MSSWMNALHAHIAANSLGTPGSTLFIGTMGNADGDEATVALARYKGTEREVMGGNGLDVPMLQVAVRAKSYDDAEDRIIAIRSLLRSIVNTTVQGQAFVRVAPDGDLKDLKRDDRGRQQFTADFQVWVQA